MTDLAYIEVADGINAKDHHWSELEKFINTIGPNVLQGILQYFWKDEQGTMTVCSSVSLACLDSE